MDGALAAPLCDGQQIEPKIARTLRTRLRKARRLLDRATHAQPRKAGRLAATADRLLAGVLSPLQKSTSRGKTTGECQTAVTDLISHLRQEIALARAPA